jgi:hypothetical protein
MPPLDFVFVVFSSHFYPRSRFPPILADDQPLHNFHCLNICVHRENAN